MLSKAAVNRRLRATMAFKQAQFLTNVSYPFTLEPGDVLFNPSFHWHHVTNLTVSISASCRFWSLPSALQSSPMLSAVTALATNPPAFVAVLRTWRGAYFLNFYRPG